MSVPDPVRQVRARVQRPGLHHRRSRRPGDGVPARPGVARQVDRPEAQSADRGNARRASTPVQHGQPRRGEPQDVQGVRGRPALPGARGQSCAPEVDLGAHNHRRRVLQLRLRLPQRRRPRPDARWPQQRVPGYVQAAEGRHAGDPRHLPHRRAVRQERPTPVVHAMPRLRSSPTVRMERPALDA